MATDLENEMDAFHRFIGEKLQNGDLQLTLEQALNEFRACQRDLERFQRDTQQSLEESARGESSTLDIEDVVQRGEKRLAEKGVMD